MNGQQHMTQSLSSWVSTGPRDTLLGAHANCLNLIKRWHQKLRIRNKTTQNFTLVVGGRNSTISLETRTQVPFKVEHLLFGIYTLSFYIYILIHRQHRPIIRTLRGCRQVDCCQFRNDSVYAVSPRPTEVINSETLFQKTYLGFKKLWCKSVPNGFIHNENKGTRE